MRQPFSSGRAARGGDKPEDFLKKLGRSTQHRAAPRTQTDACRRLRPDAGDCSTQRKFEAKACAKSAMKFAESIDVGDAHVLLM
jgi:hypothetical protein